MKQFLNLFTSVKKIIALVMLALFAVMVLKGQINSQEFMGVFMLVMGTYFAQSISKQNKQ